MRRVDARAIAWAAAIAAPLLAAGAARLAGGSWLAAAASALVAGIALYLASRNRTTDEQLADIGRGAVVGMILAFTAAWIDHEAAARSARESREAAARSARESLAFTLSSSGPFRGIDLHGKDLSGFYVSGKDFSNADLRGVRLEGAAMQATRLDGANLERAVLAGADLRDAQMTGRTTNLRGAALAHAILTGANVSSATLVDTDLRGANLEGATLTGADLRGADLRGAILAGADLRLALLVGTDLRGAILSGDLRDAKLDGAGLAHARWDSTTRWPDGVDPRKVQRHEEVPVPAGAETDTVTRVVDADTLVFKRLGGVRLLGLNAPASDLGPPDCYGRRATRTMQRLLPDGVGVRYVLGDEPADKFGRALAYIWRADGLFVNEAIVEQGAATFLPPDTKQPRKEPPQTKQQALYIPVLRRAEVRAANERRGVWISCGAPKS
jgi:uncharacterized protein YjbI with pentapeptide repeats/endonuclease YncB( thermonuclease family)